MKPTPAGWPRISSALAYDDPRAAIEWLGAAFGFEARLIVEGDDGGILHSELVFGDGLIMVGGKRDTVPQHRTPREAGGNTQSLMVYVDDLDAHCARARAAGAVIVKEIATHDYGDEYWVDRSYEARDVGGHHWWFTQRLSDPTKPPPVNKVVRE